MTAPLSLSTWQSSDPFVGAKAGYFPQHNPSAYQAVPVLPLNLEGKMALVSRGNIAPNSSSETSEADVVFIAEWARRYSDKEGAALTGMTPKGFQKLKSGDNSISYKRLRQWMRNDIAFAIAHAVETGVILPGQAESAEAITRAVNAYMRRGE